MCKKLVRQGCFEEFGEFYSDIYTTIDSFNISWIEGIDFQCIYYKLQKFQNILSCRCEVIREIWNLDSWFGGLPATRIFFPVSPS